MKDLFLVGLNRRLWSLFQALHQSRGSLPMSIEPSQALMVADSMDPKNQRLVAGAVVYSTDGPWMMVENLVANPAFSIFVRSQATDLILASARAIATAQGHWLIACPSKKGLYRFLLKRGFTAPRAAIVVSPPGFVVPIQERTKRFERKSKMAIKKRGARNATR